MLLGQKGGKIPQIARSCVKDGVDTQNNLSEASSSDDFKRRLQERLDILVGLMEENDPGFVSRVTDLERAYANYFEVRDTLLKEIHSNKLSFEYANEHPLGEPNRSRVRFIYSHQPTEGPWIITANTAATFYHQDHQDFGWMRDVQIAGQLDRRLGEVADLGNPTLTLGVYYQWMKEDALLTIDPGNLAPGTAIMLPGEATTLLETKGHIGIFQAKISIPLTTGLKLPLSFTWANRTELIKEVEVRGQIGLTFDFDGLFQ